MKYTEEDIIWKVDDPRLKDAIGKECYPSDSYILAIDRANADMGSNTFDDVDEEDETPFTVIDDEGFMFSYPFIILKKEEPEKSNRIVPYDFNLVEDRKAVKGKWLERKESSDEFLVVGFSMACAMFAEDVVVNWGKGTSRSFGDGKELLDQFVFADTGKPVGKEVGE